MKIKVENINKRIKGTEVIRNFSYEFESGCKYAIIGHNGSGKTMLLKSLSGLIIPTSGKISFADKVMHDDFRFYESMGVIIETTSFYPHLTGYENLKLLSSVKKKISDSEIQDALRKVNLLHAKNQIVKRYSLGMNQRLAIAQAIMDQPEVLLLDEPTIALDEESKELFFNILEEFKNNNKIVIVATNEIHELKNRYDKYIKLSDGELVISGDTKDF